MRHSRKTDEGARRRTVRRWSRPLTRPSPARRQEPTPPGRGRPDAAGERTRGAPPGEAGRNPQRAEPSAPRILGSHKEAPCSSISCGASSM